ncbi:hypothetical protein JOF53_002289 [Crossiella equi]|uniref:Abortive infection protein n=1 Tax=Crossiella equi TaxID=130796 RepID=A0ABS5AAU5_9PSEU|nr:hypothetical protein [Crossiella equi]MBP2473417.1 hypothetical protein [Crossiella equi]
MRAKGISYDTGFHNRGHSTHEPFLAERVRRDMHAIRHDLHCTAVRVTGGDPDRLELACRLAAEQGLEVWFSPFPNDLTTEELLPYLADCARRAERLRREGAEVVLLTGAELSLVVPGFLPGEAIEDRIAALTPETLHEVLPGLLPRLNAFLAEAVAEVRRHFGGRVSYAAIPFERVDWSPFDLVSVDLYRSAEVAEQYLPGLAALIAQGKPVAVTEFGSATHTGAAAKGARGGEIVRWRDREPVGLTGAFTRDEREQAEHLREMVALLAGAGVDSAFVYTYANFHLPRRAETDLDLASYGVVAIEEDGTRTPKQAYAAVATTFADLA